MKTALVTGANKGIGFEISKKLLKEGYHVLVGARDESRGKNAIKELAKYGHVDLIKIDYSDSESIKEAVQRVSNEYKELNLLVNNAGIPGPLIKRPSWEFTKEELLETYTVDFLGPFELSKGLLPILIENHGKIVNVSIPIEPMPFPNMNPFAYLTGKAPLNIMTKSWGISIDESALPVQIFAVMPGAVSTDLNNHTTGKGVKMPEEAAEWIVGLALDEKNHNGQVINFEGKLADYKNLV
ncbi:SDR family NAD(P)-dependent oxidoreductase [Clostridium beijerinckii]|uniref:SDR family NAD(P)-dependent oxidoreductase n=1 Tax=Clostridium beijerinckii TaxID=1520 RepID=UPI0022E79FAA|nr:SDR family NAD(P)-dependent oxidoreductase [Clostridium beijerinckii]